MNLIIPVVIFAVAALGGLILLLEVRGGAAPPLSLALIHGLAGAAGLVLLLWGVLSGAGGLAGRLAAGLFVVAALGGFYLFAHHLRGQRVPFSPAVVHGAVAVAGFTALLIAAFAGG